MSAPKKVPIEQIPPPGILGAPIVAPELAYGCVDWFNYNRCPLERPQPQRPEPPPRQHVGRAGA